MKTRKNLQQFIKNKQCENESSRNKILLMLRNLVGQILKLYPTVSRISVVGSVAGGRFSSNSDVDIVVHGLEKNDYFKLYNFLESNLAREIDLIVEEELSEEDKKHIMSKQEVLYDIQKDRR